jgi:membrane protein YdbS with pleckstrin-like domain
MTDESVLLRIRPEMIRARPIQFALSVVLIPAYGLGLVLLAYWWLSTVSRELTVTPRRVRKRSGILANQTTELRHADVKNVQVSQGPIQNLLNTGTLRLSSAGQAGIELTMTDIDDPQGVRDVIYQQQDH